AVADLAYQFPSIELLEQAESDQQVDMAEIEENKQTLLDKLETYNIQITEIDAVVGPTVTRYELTPAPGIKISRITALEDDLAMALAAPGIRIIAPIPGKSSIGVEIPNRSREMVRLRQTLSTPSFRDAARGGKMALPIPIGKTIEGGVFVEDLAKMPHLLVAGATGSGKSVGVNALIVGLLYAKHPADLKFVMIDPKKIELNGYATLLNHFSAMPVDAEDPIITDFSQAAAVLRSCEREMELRYDLLAEAGVRGIVEYNAKQAAGTLKGLGPKHRHLPYLVVIVDELADLMMTSAKEVEAPIARLAQMARAVGIHLVLATQRPSVDVITGLIKANFPSRMAYQTSSKIDSRTIIDGGGAHQLVGNGDLLHMNGSRLTRLQGPYVSVEEVEAVTAFIGGQDGPGPYLLPPMDPHESAPAGAAGDSSEDRDDLFEDAARVIVRSQQGSVSLLQRKLSVGYTRAARLVDQLEDAGIVGPFEGSKAREVLVTSEFQLDEMLNGTPSDLFGEDV
ncbi:MAG TPA: DNA translocase FtsK, partial [Rubricoccaceae bacterium]